MKIFGFLLLFYTHLLLGQTHQVSSLLQQLDTVNSNSATELQCIEVKRSLGEQCARDLCGDPANQVSTFVTDENIDLYIDRAAKLKLPEYESDIKKAIFNQKKEVKQLIYEAKKIIANDPSFIKNLDIPSSMFEKLAFSTFRSYFSLGIDRSSPADQRVKFQMRLKSHEDVEFQEGLEDYIQGRLEFLKNSTIERLRLGVYSKEEVKKLLTDKLDLISSDFKNMDNEMIKNGTLKKQFEELSLKLSAIADNSEIVELYRGMQIVHQELYSISGKEFPYEEKPSPKCPSACQRETRNSLSSKYLLSVVTNLEKRLENYDEEFQFANCKAGLISKSLKSASEENFRKFYPDLKKRFIANVFKSYSRESADAFQNYLDSDLDFNFDNLSTGYEELVQQIKTTSSKKDVSPLGAALIVEKLVELQNDYFAFDRTFNACPDMLHSTNILYDGYFSNLPEKSDVIRVSPLSCSHQEIGIGVVAHEMGHALSYFSQHGKLSETSKKSYQSLKSCVTSLYIRPIIKGENGEHLHAEEDMADVISQLVTPNAPPLCLLLQTTDDKREFKTSLFSDGVVKHSPPLLRVLNQSLYRYQQLPSSCMKLMENNKSFFRFDSCL